MIKKACPIIIEKRDSKQKILVFRHPIAGVQLVKGTVENNESASNAAIREMKEESGTDVLIEKHLGHILQEDLNQYWDVYLVKPKQKLPETWSFETIDDGGRLFEFYWEDVEKDFYSDKNWDRRYIKVIELARGKI